jgi:hypothetical protein
VCSTRFVPRASAPAGPHSSAPANDPSAEADDVPYRRKSRAEPGAGDCEIAIDHCARNPEPGSDLVVGDPGEVAEADDGRRTWMFLFEPAQGFLERREEGSFSVGLVRLDGLHHALQIDAGASAASLPASRVRA